MDLRVLEHWRIDGPVEKLGITEEQMADYYRDFATVAAEYEGEKVIVPVPRACTQRVDGKLEIREDCYPDVLAAILDAFERLRND